MVLPLALMENKLVTIATFPDALKAQIIRGRLEAEGILCFIADEHTITNQPYLAMIHGGVRLQVQERDSEQAQKIIQVTQWSPEPLEFAPLPLTEQCPNCSSRKIEEVKSLKSQSFLTFLRNLLSSRTRKTASRHFICRTCGHKWLIES